MEDLGNRLKEERQRLDMTLADFSALGGVQKSAQLRYEKGERMPMADYLYALHLAGVDVVYVLLGERKAAALPAEEADLITRYRAAPIAVRAAVSAALAAGVEPTKTTQNFKGASIGQQVTGDVTGPFEINMGGKKKRRSE